ncbi:hypothetical protein GGR56DRAFT_106759 [Xylariaceae sp. FL0804]|nr:hypothetical protein GGR56DRAFT_106759 [Xylariaceae sp. FL0804]
MPVTIYPAPHPSEPCQLSGLLRNASPEDVLRGCVAVKLKNGQTNPIQALDTIWQSSFDAEGHVDVYPSANGFVHAAVRAYNGHHHLRIRPDDVWIAILSQLSIYVNTHAEALRSIFVSHQGQKPLSLEGAVLRGFDQFASKITEVLSNSVKDQTLPRWIMQEFSTTTPTDRIAAGIIMMATFQAYFAYFDAITCGLPSVTLLGERADWVQLCEAIERLGELVPAEGGPSPVPGKAARDLATAQMTKWASVLKPVLARFVRSFDSPAAAETVDFWQRIADYRVGGSGADYLTGWLTAFCFWTENGECTFPLEETEGRSQWALRALRLDDACYTSVDWKDLPPGWASVPLEIINDGQVRKCRMLAGSVGITPFMARVEERSASSSSKDEKKKKAGRGRRAAAAGEAEQQHGTAASKRQSGRGRGSLLLRRMLTCCDPERRLPDDAPVDAPVDAPTKPKPKSKPFPAPGEVVSLPPPPPYSSSKPSLGYHDKKTTSSAATPYYEAGPGSRADDSYTVRGGGGGGGGGDSDGNGVEPPPGYRLDGVQPRIGWWLWAEKEDKSGKASPLLPAGSEDGVAGWDGMRWAGYTLGEIRPLDENRR